MVLPVINIGSKLDGKGFKQAETATEKLGKSVKGLAKSFGLAFSVAQIVQFGKAAAKAFAEDEKAATRLTQSVKNLGLGFEDARIKDFISDLESAAGVADDILRPAFQTLLQTTGSVTRSQELLKLALDISAGSGVDAAQVAKDLSLAYLGQTKGLAKYNTGLTKAELSVAGFEKLQNKLNDQYSGQNAQRLETYAGKMEYLGVAAGNAQEIIGKGLVDALMILTGDTTVEELAESMKTAADNTARLTTNIAQVVKVLNTPIKTAADSLAWFIENTQKYVDLLVEGDPSGFFKKMDGKKFGQGNRSASPAGTAAAAKARAKAEADAARRAKELAALQKKAALAEKNKLSLSKAAAEFDTNRISIAAALKNTYDKETRLRLEALMAIEDEEGDKALDRIEQLGILTKAKQAEKLNGLKGITETELLGLNSTLLAELDKIETTKDAKIKAINASGADQAAKDAAKLEAINAADAAEAKAFAKYNDALAKQGGLNDLSFYSKKTQISTLEVLELASIEKTQAAQLVADEIALAAGIKTVEEIAAARKAAQDADNKSMAEYEAARKIKEDQATSDYFASLKTKTDAALTADADLTAAKLKSISTVAAAEAEANAAAIAGVGALATAIKSIPPYPTWTPPPAAEMPGAPFVETVPGSGLYPELPPSLGGLLGEMPPLLDLGPNLYIDPGLVNPGGNAGGNYTITINAGAIASQDEFSALLQETIQDINRKGDPLFTAGIS